MQAGLEQFQLADELGFDWITLAEHHYAPLSLTPNPMVMAGAVSQRVRRAKIALLGANLPSLNPVRVAEEFAMVDVLTGGRLVAGMLRGTATEYVTYGTNPAESRERFEEALQLILKAWTEPQPFGWLGRYYEYRTIAIWPRPIQQPHPPVFMSGSSPESGELAARHRLHLGLAFTTVPLAREAARYYREQAAAAGWEPTSEHLLYRLPVHVADTDEQALEDLRCPARQPDRPRTRPAIGQSARPWRARATTAATRRPSGAVCRSVASRSASSSGNSCSVARTRCWRRSVRSGHSSMRGFSI